MLVVMGLLLPMLLQQVVVVVDFPRLVQMPLMAGVVMVAQVY